MKGIIRLLKIDDSTKSKLYIEYRNNKDLKLLNQILLQKSDWTKIIELNLIDKEIDWLFKCCNCGEKGCIDQCHPIKDKVAMLYSKYHLPLLPITYTEKEVKTITRFAYNEAIKFFHIESNNSADFRFNTWWEQNKKK